MKRLRTPRRGAKLLRAAWSIAAVLFSSVLFSSGSAAAATVTVNCDGPPAPGTFSSITAALNTLDLIGPHTINVTGTCVENINLFQRERLTIQSVVGQTAIIASAVSTPTPVVSVNGSRNIFLRGLEIRDGLGPGISVARGSDLFLQGCRISGNRGNGLQAGDNSNIILGGITGGPLMEISDNGASGLVATGSVLAITGFTVIENNRGVGLIITAGRASINGTQRENIIRGNGSGVSTSGASVTFVGQNTIQNNGATGVTIGGGFVSFSAATLPDGTQRVNTIEGHILGLNVAAAASASFIGRNRIRGNGHPDATGMFRGGIRIGTVSRIQLDGGNEITDNIGYGLFADFNGALSVNGTRVANNTEGGVRVARLSVGNFGAGNIFEGNGGANISCDTTALIFGELTGIPSINCRNIEREHGPPRPGAVRDLPPQ